VRLYDQFLRAEAGHETFAAMSNAGTGEGKNPNPGPTGFADTARRENYFSIFEKNASDIGFLDPGLVNDVTAFYTFLKGSRDATLVMNRWSESHYDYAKKKEDIIGIIYLVFLMMVHGKRSLDRLLKSSGNERFAEDIIAGIMLQCFFFLDRVMSDTD